MSFNGSIRKIDLPKIFDERGNLSFIEASKHIPFNIERVYWIYDVPGGEVRGSHAFKDTEEFIVALSGSFDVVLHDGDQEHKFSLNRSYYGVYIPKLTWRRLENFSTNSLALVIASKGFSEDEYIREYEQFIDFIKSPLSLIQPRTIHLKRTLPKYLYTKTTVGDCCVVDFGRIHSLKGNITLFENFQTLPIQIKRVYYLYDVPSGVERGGHAHKALYQVIIAASGSFDVILKDGINRKTISLNRPFQALYLIPGIWREIVNFSSGSSCLVLASNYYSEDDYIREYDDFIKGKIVN